MGCINGVAIIIKPCSRYDVVAQPTLLETSKQLAIITYRINPTQIGTAESVSERHVRIRFVRLDSSFSHLQISGVSHADLTLTGAAQVWTSGFLSCSRKRANTDEGACTVRPYRVLSDARLLSEPAFFFLLALESLSLPCWGHIHQRLHFRHDLRARQVHSASFHVGIFTRVYLFWIISALSQPQRPPTQNRSSTTVDFPISVSTAF